MLYLVFSKIPNIKVEVVLAYWRLFLCSGTQKPKEIAKNLIKLFSEASLPEKTCLEQILETILVKS